MNCIDFIPKDVDSVHRNYLCLFRKVLYNRLFLLLDGLALIHLGVSINTSIMGYHRLENSS